MDDEEVIRSFTRSALEPYGYGVLLAENGEEALRLFAAKSGEIALVLPDVAMPGMDGVETLTRIRQTRTDVPVLVCTGLGNVEVEARFEGRPVAGFFAKPYTAKQPARKVKECIAPPSGGAGG